MSTATIDDNIWISIRRVLGGAGVKQLMRAMGGLDLCAPVRQDTLHDEHPLVVAIGEEKARLMVREFSGETFYVRKEFQDIPGNYVRAMQRGMSNRAIARMMGVSERTVRRQLHAQGFRNPIRNVPVRRPTLPASPDNTGDAIAA